MTSSKTHDWLQLVGSVGVLLGLLMVAYEIRQNNKLAEAEANRAMYDGWEVLSIAEFETDIMDLYVKSIESPQELSSNEMLKLNAYYTALMTQYDRQSEMFDRGLQPKDPTIDLIDSFDIYFGSHFSRAWYSEARVWIEPRLVEVIDREMTARPPKSSSDYIDRIKSQIPD